MGKTPIQLLTKRNLRKECCETRFSESLLTGTHQVIENFTEIRMYLRLRVAALVQFYPIATSDLMSYHLFTWRDDIKFKATI